MHSKPRKPYSALAIAALGVDLGSGPVPADVRLIPAGEFRSHDGRPDDCPAWLMTAEDGARLVAEASARTSAVVIDYEHATLHAKKTGDKAVAAGWFNRLEWRADGLWATGVDWTALAAQHIAAREYRYLSPVFSYDPATGRVQKLYHAALTNDPGLDGLTDLAALAAQLLLPTPNPQETSMPEILKKLLAALGLQETASEAEALAALAGLKTHVAALTAQVAQPDPAKYVAVAVLTAAQAEHAQTQEKLAALSAEIDAGKLEKVIADGLAAGKLTPATEVWAREHGKKDLAMLTAHLAVAPVIVKPGETQSGTAALHALSGAGLSDVEVSVAKALGQSAAQFIAGKQEI